MVCCEQRLWTNGPFDSVKSNVHSVPPSPDHSTHCDIVTADIVEQLIAEIGKIKTQLSNTELQLYEANEKMADIIENVCARELNSCHVSPVLILFLWFLFAARPFEG